MKTRGKLGDSDSIEISRCYYLMTFSSFSQNPMDEFARKYFRPFGIVVRPGYQVPDDLVTSNKDALWIEGDVTEDTEVWDGFCKYALFEIIYECFDYAGPGETIGVKDLDTGDWVEDDRDPWVMSCRPNRVGYYGYNGTSNRFDDLLVWASLLEGPGSSETATMYRDLRDFNVETNEALDSKSIRRICGREMRYANGKDESEVIGKFPRHISKPVVWPYGMKTGPRARHLYPAELVEGQNPWSNVDNEIAHEDLRGDMDGALKFTRDDLAGLDFIPKSYYKTANHMRFPRLVTEASTLREPDLILRNTPRNIKDPDYRERLAAAFDGEGTASAVTAESGRKKTGGILGRMFGRFRS